MAKVRFRCDTKGSVPFVDADVADEVVLARLRSIGRKIVWLTFDKRLPQIILRPIIHLNIRRADHLVEFFFPWLYSLKRYIKLINLIWTVFQSCSHYRPDLE